MSHLPNAFPAIRALKHRARALAGSSALNSAPRFATAALWAALIATAAVTVVLGDINRAQALDLLGNSGGTAPTWGNHGGAGNGGGGSAYNKGGVGDKRSVLAVGGQGVTGATGLGNSGGGAGGAGGAVGATNIGSGLTQIVGNGGKAGGAHLNAGAGGGGGAGVFLKDQFLSTYLDLVITGGGGGTGGAAVADAALTDAAGGGGGGGAGTVLEGGELINVRGALIVGGKGGAAGKGLTGTAAKNLAGAGAGGDGVLVMNGAHFTNLGSVKGGDAGDNAQSAENQAFAGSGVRIGDNGYFINEGIVAPGQSQKAGAAAIVIAGNDATLELHSGSNIQGAVIAIGGAKNASLLVGDDEDQTLDLNIGIFDGFAKMSKTGSNTLLLSGSTSAITPWHIEEGKLVASVAGSLG
ncbi:hypothetical protein WKW50_25850, partial [Ochrobactrum sp. GPK 3]